MLNKKDMKPIIKWVGGKTQIIDKITYKVKDAFDGNSIDNYHEIFIGGGSVLLAFLSLVKSGDISISGRVYAYDANEALIYLYKNIQDNATELYNEIHTIINEFNKCGESDIKNRRPSNINEAKASKESYYYWIRKQYNECDKNTIKASAMFIFLNKTCFRGLYRCGPNGFNVPYGNYKNPEICNKQHIDSVSELIKDVVFECCDFSVSLQRVSNNDFVYLDPPYVQENKRSFVGYTENGFGIEKHNQLFDIIHNMNYKCMLMSNSHTKLVLDRFTIERGYDINVIECKRSINSKNPQSKTNEILIYKAK